MDMFIPARFHSSTYVFCCKRIRVQMLYGEFYMTLKVLEIFINQTAIDYMRPLCLDNTGQRLRKVSLTSAAPVVNPKSVPDKLLPTPLSAFFYNSATATLTLTLLFLLPVDCLDMGPQLQVSVAPLLTDWWAGDNYLQQYLRGGVGGVQARIVVGQALVPLLPGGLRGGGTEEEVATAVRAPTTTPHYTRALEQHT